MWFRDQPHLFVCGARSEWFAPVGIFNGCDNAHGSEYCMLRWNVNPDL